MEFDFIDAYRRYSNKELLKIILQPGDYQSQAVLAAEEVLKTREVSEEERQEIETLYTGVRNKAKQKKEKIDAYKEKAADVFEPILHPGTAVKAEKRFNLFLIALSLAYSRNIFYAARSIIWDLKYPHSFSDPLITLLNFAEILYAAALLYLLYKRKKAGLIVLLSTTAFFLAASAAGIPVFYRVHFFGRPSILSFLYQTFLKAAIIVFLCREDIIALFGISVSLRNKTVLISASAGFLLAAYMVFHYG